jgi:hypothetical protein
LGIATRFDYLVFCLVALAAMTWWAEPRNRRSIILQNALFFFGCAIAICAIQRMYWGSWLPNTYHLKMDGVDAIERISRGFSSGLKVLPILVLLLTAVLLARKSSRLIRETINLSVAIFAAMALYTTFIGGDAWEDQMLNRFYATVLPVVPIVIVLSIRQLTVFKTSLLIAVGVTIGSLGLGVSVNPVSITQQRTVVGLLIALLFGAGIVVTTSMKGKWTKQMTMIGTLVCVILFAGAIPITQQIRNNDYFATRTNLHVTETVETLQGLLNEKAVVATVWAGVPAYYLRQPMFDLLGKNDTRIARSAPHGEFFPGHNKWDYDYGIGVVRPDVVFQTFTRGIEENLDSRILAWGYIKKCTQSGTFPKRGIYFLSSSSNVKWNKLTTCGQ